MIERIKKIMEFKQINAGQFADEIGVQRSAMSHVLSGRNNPSLDFMLKIKSAYPNINLDWLLIGEGNMMENLVSEKTKTQMQERFALEIEFPDVESEIKKETLAVESAQVPVKPNDYEIKNEVKKEFKKSPKQIIVLYNDNTFELFDPI